MYIFILLGLHDFRINILFHVFFSIVAFFFRLSKEINYFCAIEKIEVLINAIQEHISDDVIVLVVSYFIEYKDMA